MNAQRDHVVLCGYRDWALNAFSRIESIADSAMWDVGFRVVKAQHDLVQHFETLRRLQPVHAANEIVFCAGWSWLLPKDIVDSNLCVGVHPSDLPAFAGGSPIQHQILSGVRNTKATLFRMRPQLDAGEIVCKSDLSLEGHMTDVFKELERVTMDLFVKFWTAHRAGQLTFTPQEHSESLALRRFKPEDSQLPWHKLGKLTCRQLWDAVRCREDPYPNAYVEDESGDRLVFKHVEFERRPAK